MCRGCNNHTFVGHAPRVVERLSANVQDQFKIAQVGRKYVTHRLMRLVRDAMQESGKISGVVSMVKSLHKSAYIETVLSYYLANKAIAVRNNFDDAPAQFPAYDDRDAWGGCNITHHLIREIFTLSASIREPFLDARMQMLDTGLVIKGDESFKICKIMKLNGTVAFDSLLLIMNDKHEVITFQFTEDQSHASYEQCLAGLAGRLPLHGYKGPVLVYLDQCCRDGSLFMRLFPTLNNLTCDYEGAYVRVCVRVLRVRVCADGSH